METRRQLLATQHHGNLPTDKPPSALEKLQGLSLLTAAKTTISYGLGAIAGYLVGLVLGAFIDGNMPEGQ